MNRLEVLTMNTLGIPIITRNYSKRLKALVREIEKTNPDVVCLQELWSSRTRRWIIRDLDALGYRFYAVPEGRYRLNGLITFSRHEIVEIKSKSLKPWYTGINISLIELPCYKGFLLTKIKVDEKIFNVYNVHLLAQYTNKNAGNSSYGKVTHRALSKITQIIDGSNQDKTLICGDFNFEPNSWLYNWLIETTKIIDRVPETYKTLTKLLFKFPYPSKGRRVDHIFTKNIQDDEVSYVKLMWDSPLEDIGYLSDHAGLLIALNFAE